MTLRLIATAGLMGFATNLAGSHNTPKLDTSKGSVLYRECKAYVSNDGSPRAVDDGNICVSYIEGFADGRGPTFKFACLVGVPPMQMVEAYLKWMDANREYMQMSKRLGVDAALTKAFCFYYKDPPKN